MDLFILDATLRRTALIDQYKSLIWTERYAAWGDFELVIRSSYVNRMLFQIGTNLAINESHRMMTVETVEATTDSEGVSMLTISGRSLERVLDNRVAMPAMVGLETTPKWVLTGTPGFIARTVFRTIIHNWALSDKDDIPFLQSFDFYASGSIPEPSEEIQVEFEPDTVYNSIKKICDLYNLGFSLRRNRDKSQIFFNVYTGNNRTTLQTTYAPVIFSQELDNLTNTSELTSVASEKNVAYVFSKFGAKFVYADGTDPGVGGVDRRVLLVKADDIDQPAGTILSAMLEQRGKEALADYRPVLAFDGEIAQVDSYKYERDYALGDLVEKRNSDGLSTSMLVTEQIFISDEEGDRSYPTLTMDQLITPGSWLAWDASQMWDDAQEMWDEA